MVITWHVRRPPSCAEHGPLAPGPLPALDAAIVMLGHLADAHGKNVTRALETLAARRAAHGPDATLTP